MQEKQKQPRKLKVMGFNCHQAVTFKGESVNGIGSKPSHAKVELELHPAGILALEKSEGLLVPYANIQYAKIKVEE
jgi:hypothetical protein